MLKYLRETFRKNTFLRKFIAYHLASSGFFDDWFRTYPLSKNWALRCNDVVSCPDNADIPRCETAGQIKRGKQYLHNSIQIYVGSYYGPEYAQVLLQNRGVHEPQEEKVFGEVLKYLPDNAVMFELGAFWGFYSMWFNKYVRGAKNFLIEPDEFNLGQGKRNFRLNGMKGNFTNAFVGKKSSDTTPVATICVDDYRVQNGIDRIHLLHSDIQGFEYEMLEGAVCSMDEGKIDYIFISTHSQDIHRICLALLQQKAFRIIAEADLDNSYSEDGLIVAAAAHIREPQQIKVAKKIASSCT